MSTAHKPTPFEQLMLEYVNRARLDPSGEFDALIASAGSVTGVQSNITSALRYFGVDMDVLAAQFAALDPVAPLAWHGALASAADEHGARMIAADTQSHQLPGEASLGDRVRDAGYTFTSVAENVYAYTQDPLHGHAGFFIDWGFDAVDSGRSDFASVGDGIQDAAGHRVAIMNARYTEVGISALDDSADDARDSVGPYAVTQNFGARSGYVPQLLGVVIDDADGDRFYDMGEGLGGVAITATGAAGVFTTYSWDAGGYQMALPSGLYSVTFSGGGLDGTVTVQVTIGSANVKQDAIAGDATRAIAGLDRAGTGAGERLLGGAGDDTIAGGGGSDMLEGGAGDDILCGDALPLAAASELAGQVYRLYRATLEREPDNAGHAHWVTQLFEARQALSEVAQGFVGSAEFQTRYGSLSDSDFVTLLYRSVLDRDPDAAGLSGWVAQLQGGASRAGVVLGFSESAEFGRDTAASAAAFAETGTAALWQDDVYRLYRATLDRVPDLGGFLGWVEALGAGRDYLSVIDGFVASAEFQARYGALSNGDFVELLYGTVLDRASDAAGKAGWLAQLDGGASRAEVVRGFAQSGEFVTETAGDLAAWVRSQGPDDVLQGGSGSNLLAGGLLMDVFVFTPDDGGEHAVIDLEPWDLIDLEGFGYASAAQARGQMTQQGADLVLADQGVSVTFTGTMLAQISDDMLLL